MSFLINGGIPEGDLPVKAPSGASNIRYVEGGKSYSSPMPDIVTATEQMQAAIDGIVASTEAQANALLDSLGYTPPVAYSGGISVTYSNQTVEYNGNIYAPKSADIPFTTSGTFETSKFRLVLQGSFLQAGAGAVYRNVQDKLRETVTIQDYGGLADGSTSIVDAINKARNAGVKRLRLPAGTYVASGELDVGSMTIEGDGEATTVIASAGFSGNYLFKSEGSLTAIENLGAPATVGKWMVTFDSPPSLAAGDIFLIYNPTDYSWSGYRPVYRAGEWCEVDYISGNIVYLKSPLYDSYAQGDVSVYRLEGKSPVIRNIRVAGAPGPVGLCDFKFCTMALVENLTGSLGNNSVISIDKCFRTTIINPQADNYGDGGDDYGVAVANSQHLRIIGGAIYARRHGVASGGTGEVGAVPVRDTRITGAVVRTSSSSNVAAADFHGNSEDSSFENCTIYGGGMSRGKNIYYRDCTIYAVPDLGVCIQGSEILGGTHGFHNCRFVTYDDPQSTNRGILDFGGNSVAFNENMREPLTIEVVGCSVNGRSLSSSTAVIRVVNRGTTHRLNVHVDGLRLDVNAVGSILFTNMESAVAVAASDAIVVDNIFAPAGTQLHNASGGFYRDVPHRLIQQCGSWSSVSTSDNSKISAPISFRYVYPRTPVVTVALRPVGDGTLSLGGQVGGQTAVPSVYQCTGTNIRPMVRTTGATAMAAGDPFVLSWGVGIREC